MSEKSTNNLLVIFGATGDLSKRKLLPALYSLYEQDALEHTSILAIGRKPFRSEEFRTYLRSESLIKTEYADDRDGFLEKIDYLELPMNDPDGYGPLRTFMQAHREKNITFYLSVPQELFEPIVSGIAHIGLNTASSKVAFEKPFGSDLESATKLNAFVTQAFSEDQIFRIDHYVGKETIQNILAFRFANSLFEPVWNNHYIDNIQITATESLGVENRGAYYDHAGALRDMVQNHLFQVLALATMEPPHTLTSTAIHDEKVKVIRSLRLGKDLLSHVVFGQYAGYKDEAGIPESSRTETFAALRLEVHNWRLKGVPIYLRTGKALSGKKTKVVVEFRKNASILYNEQDELDRNRIIFEISPYEGISVGFNVKEYGETKKTRAVWSEFIQTKEGPEAYARILSDLLLGDHTLFTRWDMIEESWKIVDHLVHCKENCPILHSYEKGSDGPEAVNTLLEMDGREWYE
ncbi:MAG: glucose-6-phosphate dehydrogenase [Candidatus Gracilibacteria bacterium]|nr:glucose-6-phosphate dehydrogenase [Candidatus Gracilibacteria bacterium]